MTRPSRCKPFTIALLALAACARLDAYSVLSHEALIDAVWDDSIKPLLLSRYPSATPDDLLKAHAYVYGGAIIQDLGYYPFGSRLFSDLTHYIRTGDFIENLFSDAHDLNELAFAAGSLAHYAADNAGHPSVNRSVPILYPKVRAQFGDVATYEDNPSDHLKVEFAFDVAELSERHYAPEAYHDFIGFEVAKPVLERAFLKTYGIEMKDVFTSVDLALGTYRRTVSNIIPQMTKVAWQAKKKELQRANPGASRRDFVYVMSRASYEREWGDKYERPGFWSKFLAFCFRLIPKVGPFRALAFHPATPETQKMFMEGFVTTVARYRSALSEAQRSRLDLVNTNFDTGEPARAGQYHMADEASTKLLEKMADKKQPIPQDLKTALLSFYGSAAPASLRQDLRD